MPQIVYCPNLKRYNAHIVAAAMRIVHRRTKLTWGELGAMMGCCPSVISRLKNAQHGISDIKMIGMLFALENIQGEHWRPAGKSYTSLEAAHEN